MNTKYEVAKFVKPKREDYDNASVNSESLESLEIFRALRIADPLGKAVTEMLFGKQSDE